MAGGFYLILTGAGMSTAVSPVDGDFSTNALLLGIGVVLAAAGGMMTFWRQWIVLDKTDGTISVLQGLLVPMKTTREPLDRYESIVITHIERRGKSPERFPVWIRGAGNPGENKLCDCATYTDARKRAETIARFLHYPVVDATTDHASVVPADALDEASPAASPAALPEMPAVSRPLRMLSTIGPSLSGGIEIHIPGPAISNDFFVFLLLCTLIAFGFAVGLLTDGDPTRLPGSVAEIFGALAGGLLLIPLANAVLRRTNPAIGESLVRVSGEGVELARRRLFWYSRQEVSRASILGVDYATGASRWEKNFGPSSGFSRSRFTSWRRMRSVQRGGQGIIIKAVHGSVTFGSGLPDAEVEYLFAEVVRALGEGSSDGGWKIEDRE
jgi:hypothetical protein